MDKKIFTLISNVYFNLDIEELCIYDIPEYSEYYKLRSGDYRITKKTATTNLPIPKKLVYYQITIYSHKYSDLLSPIIEFFISENNIKYQPSSVRDNRLADKKEKELLYGILIKIQREFKLNTLV